MIKMIINVLHVKPKPKPKEYLPIEIKCILYDLSDSNDDQIRNLRDYCHLKNLIFSTRRYNSSKYSDDRNYITKLPAFHVYMKDAYQNTFYLNAREINEVNIIIRLYNEKLERKRKRKEEWNKFYEQIYNLFSIRYNRSLLERTKDNEKRLEKKRIRDLENMRINQLEKLKQIEESDNKILIAQSK